MLRIFTTVVAAVSPRIRYLDELVDELARGTAMEKALRNA